VTALNVSVACVSRCDLSSDQAAPWSEPSRGRLSSAAPRPSGNVPSKSHKRS